MGDGAEVERSCGGLDVLESWSGIPAKVEPVER